MRSAPGVSLVSAVLRKSISQAQSRFNLSNPGSQNKKKLLKERKEQRKLQEKLSSQGNQISLIDFKSQLHTPISFDFESADDQFDSFIQDIKKKYICLNPKHKKQTKNLIPKQISKKLKKKGDKKKLKKLEKLLSKQKVRLLKEAKLAKKNQKNAVDKDSDNAVLGAISESEDSSISPPGKPLTLLERLRLKRLEKRKLKKQSRKEANLKLKAKELKKSSSKRMLSGSDDVDAGPVQSDSPPIVTAKLTLYSNGDGECNTKSKLVNGIVNKNLSPTQSQKSASASSKVNSLSNGNTSLKTCPKLPEPKHTLYAREKVISGWRRKVPPGVGFINMGNSCYMNATLQALFHTPALFNWLTGDEDHRSRCHSSQQFYQQCMVCAMQNTLKESIKSPNCIRPLLIHNRLKSICKHFTHGRQEDAHEFLRYLLESMEKSYLSAINALKLDNRSKETTPLGQIFGGYIRTEVTCMKCQNISTTFQPLAELQLDIRHSTSVEDALSNHFRREKLDNNDYKCEKCKHICPATKQFLLETAPIVLCLQLKRFTLFGSKINKPVHANRYLDLTRFLHKSRLAAQNETILKYKLASLVTHIGSSPNCGHYTAIAETSTGAFFQYDDAYVRQVSPQTALNTDAYVIIYELEKCGEGSRAKTPETASGLSSPYFPSKPKSQINGLIKTPTTSTITSAMLKPTQESFINPLKPSVTVNTSSTPERKRNPIPFLKTPAKSTPNSKSPEGQVLLAATGKPTTNGVGLHHGNARSPISFSLCKPEPKGISASPITSAPSNSKLVINGKVNGVLPATSSYLTPSARAKYSTAIGDQANENQKNANCPLVTPPKPGTSTLKLVPYDDEEEKSGEDDDIRSRKSKSRSKSPLTPRKGIKLFSVPSNSGIQSWDGEESQLATATDQERKRNFDKTEDELHNEEIDLGRLKKSKKERRSSSGDSPFNSSSNPHQNKFQVYSDNKKLVNERLGPLQRGASPHEHEDEERTQHHRSDHSSDRHRHHHHGGHSRDRDHHHNHHSDKDRERGTENENSSSKSSRFQGPSSFASYKSNSISSFSRNTEQQHHRNTWNRNQHPAKSFRRNFNHHHPYSNSKFQHKGNRGGGNGRYNHSNNRRF